MPRTIAETRSDPASARKIIGSVFEPTPGAPKRSCIEFLAASIEYLSLQNPDRWGVTLFNWGLRLNVGWVECLVLRREGLNVLVEKESAPAATKFRRFSYDNAPGCDMTTVSLAKLPESLASFAESHHAALSIVAMGRGPTRNVRNAHSAGVTAFLSHFLRRLIPNPSYYPPPAELPILMQLDEEAGHETYSEGRRATVMVNRFERDFHAREKCISHLWPALLSLRYEFRRPLW